MSNYRLTVPEPEIKLYEQGFEGVCKLNRASDGKKLSDLVEKIAEPMVIALDAPWGAGKSVFLKCWVGAHTKREQATTVYFDAFKHDYIDDPLVSIVGALDERVADLTSENPAKSALRSGVDKAKRYAPAIGRGLLRVGASILTAGAINQIEDPTQTILDEAITASGDELGALTQDFWKTEENRRIAMEAFRESLKSIATADQKLIIVVDELDRCRPDYALNLLEVIKHFFDVPNVHFVLGVNLKELANSVRARYGAGVSAEKYLQKFVTVVMPMTNIYRHLPNNDAALTHLSNCAEQLGLGSRGKLGTLRNYVRLVEQHIGVSLRDVERITTLAKITPKPNFEKRDGPLHLYYGLLVLKVVSPDAFNDIRSKSLTRDRLFRIFSIGERSKHDPFASSAYDIWMLATSSNADDVPTELRASSERLFGNASPPEVLHSLITEDIDALEFLG
ncbi:MAG: KAP family P-loop NTPase fold protein [Pikeienuella sp.]